MYILMSDIMEKGKEKLAKTQVFTFIPVEQKLKKFSSNFTFDFVM